MVGLGAAALLAAPFALVAAVVAPTAANAAQSMTITPAGPYKGGESVTVKVTGFSPNAPIAMGLCKQGRTATGPGDCAASKTGGSRLVTANAQGNGEGKITILAGPIGNSKPPLDSCGPKNPCYLGAANITNAKEAVNKDIKYVGVSTSSIAKKTTTVKKTPSGTSATKTTTVTSSGTGSTTAGSLPKTGPRETLIIGLLGLVIFQIGLVFAVRAVRSSPRRMSA